MLMRKSVIKFTFASRALPLPGSSILCSGCLTSQYHIWNYGNILTKKRASPTIPEDKRTLFYNVHSKMTTQFWHQPILCYCRLALVARNVEPSAPTIFCTASSTLHTTPPFPTSPDGKVSGASENHSKDARADAWESLLDNDDKKSNIASIPTKRENIFTVPNLLSLSRILATPYISHLVLSEQFSLALGLFFAAGVTDVLDGQIARTWPSQRSAFGTALDPLGDKILVTVMTITLTVSGIIPWPLTVLIVGRDVLLTLSVFYLRYRTCPPPVTLKRYFDPTLVNTKLNPTSISKANTVLQMAVIWLSMCAPVWDFTGHAALNALYVVTGITTVCSGIGYIFDKSTVQILKDEKKT